MDLGANTVLVTGGATGIGLALATRFLAAGSTVIVCGRRDSALRHAREGAPGLHTRVADLRHPEARVSLRNWLLEAFPSFNVLVNNAGIQRRVSLREEEPWDVTHEELAVNLEAPIHLSGLLLPHLMRQPRAAILNITSGLSFAPLAAAPIYCATKAALHSFTLSLRHQLRQTSVEVIEVVPPAVNTDLGGPGLHTFGVDVNELADSTVARIASGELEIGFGPSEATRRASREQLDAMFMRMNAS